MPLNLIHFQMQYAKARKRYPRAIVFYYSGVRDNADNVMR